MDLPNPAAHNPWLHEDFNGDEYYGWILTLPPSDLRIASITAGLFPREAGDLKIRELVQLEAQSPSKHNDELLAYIRPGGADTFITFLVALAKLDYNLQVERFSRLITPAGQPAGNPWKDEWFIPDDWYTYGHIMTLHSKPFRKASVAMGLFEGKAGRLKLEELEKLEAQGQQEHNEALLAYIMPGGAVSFRKFLSVLAILNNNIQIATFATFLVRSSQPKQQPDGSSSWEQAAEPGLPATQTPSSESFANVTNSAKMLSAISDVEKFGDAVGEHLDGQIMQDALAKELVKRKGGVVNNYRSIVKNWIKHNDKGTAELSNVSGQLFYFVEKKDMSCGEFLLMLQSLFSLAVARQVAEIVVNTEFL